MIPDEFKFERDFEDGTRVWIYHAGVPVAKATVIGHDSSDDHYELAIDGEIHPQWHAWILRPLSILDLIAESAQ